MADAIPPVLLVGCGRMGSAMLAGWRERSLSPSVAVEPSGAADALGGPDLQVVPGADGIPPEFRPAAVILAVKPQNAGSALPPYARFADGAVFLSIMAGQTIRGIRS